MVKSVPNFAENRGADNRVLGEDCAGVLVSLLRLIQFPPPPSKGAIAVTTEDLECLDSGEFLNDVIIDFYLK